MREDKSIIIDLDKLTVKKRYIQQQLSMLKNRLLLLENDKKNTQSIWKSDSSDVFMTSLDNYLEEIRGYIKTTEKLIDDMDFEII